MKTLIKNCNLVDGGLPGRNADILIEGDRIVAVGNSHRMTLSSLTRQPRCQSRLHRCAHTMILYWATKKTFLSHPASVSGDYGHLRMLRHISAPAIPPVTANRSAFGETFSKKVAAWGMRTLDSFLTGKENNPIVNAAFYVGFRPSALPLWVSRAGRPVTKNANQMRALMEIDGRRRAGCIVWPSM